MTEDVAALMLTVPNTLGIFEDQILDIARIVHAKGGYLYCDGANFNAFVGVAKPGLMGVDVMHMNLHKTFSTPHGGGGPGSGPVAVSRGARAVPAAPDRRAARRRDVLPRLRPARLDRPAADVPRQLRHVRARALLHRGVRQPDRRGRAGRGPERELHPRGARGRLPPEVRRAVDARGRLLRQEAGRARRLATWTSPSA